MGPEMIIRLSSLNIEDGSQYRPRMIESPSRQAILKKIQVEEASEANQMRLSSQAYLASRSIKISRSVGLNMGLDLEMRQ